MSFGQIYSVHIPSERHYYAWSQKMRGYLDPKRQRNIIEIKSLGLDVIHDITGLSGEILRGISKILAHRHILKQGVANSSLRISVFDAESSYTGEFENCMEKLASLPPDFDMMFWHSPEPNTEYDNNFLQLEVVDDLPTYVINGAFMQTLLDHIETRPWVAFSPYLSDMVNNLIDTQDALVLGTKDRCIIPPPRAWRSAFNEIETALTQPTKTALLNAADSHFNDS
jgi:hypothetical protein